MKYCLLLICIFTNLAIASGHLKPCQLIGLDIISKYTIPNKGTFGHEDISDLERANQIKLLKKCINDSAVCIVEAPPKAASWMNKNLTPPTDINNFNPFKTHLLFGLLQYTDKNNNQICSVALNSRAQAVPWYGVSWVVKSNRAEEYEFWGDRFSTVMTPKSLYFALLESHQEAIRDRLPIHTFTIP